MRKKHKGPFSSKTENDEKKLESFSSRSVFDGFKIVFTLPVIIYSLLLILLPLVYIFFLSVLKNDNYGGFLY